ncbi:MAG: hypothetical protein WAX66_04460 [Patescibacteria group bacterium]
MSDKTLTVEVGTKDVEFLCNALKKNGVNFSPRAENVIKGIELSKVKRILNLKVESVEDLGHSTSTQRKVIYEDAAKLGLSKCPADAALYYLLQHGNEMKIKEILVFAMDPYKDSYGDFNLFIVERCSKDDFRLYANSGNPDDYWNSYTQFVFVEDL